MLYHKTNLIAHNSFYFFTLFLESGLLFFLFFEELFRFRLPLVTELSREWGWR